MKNIAGTIASMKGKGASDMATTGIGPLHWIKVNASRSDSPGGALETGLNVGKAGLQKKNSLRRKLGTLFFGFCTMPSWALLPHLNLPLIKGVPFLPQLQTFAFWKTPKWILKAIKMLLYPNVVFPKLKIPKVKFPGFPNMKLPFPGLRLLLNPPDIKWPDIRFFDIPWPPRLPRIAPLSLPDVNFSFPSIRMPTVELPRLRLPRTIPFGSLPSIRFPPMNLPTPLPPKPVVPGGDFKGMLQTMASGQADALAAGDAELRKFMSGRKLQCQKVTPSDWYQERTPENRPLPFENMMTRLCFQMKPSDFWNCPGPGYTNCTHTQEQCVLLEDAGRPSKWAVGDYYMPAGVSVYYFSMSELALLVSAPGAMLPDWSARQARSVKVHPHRQSRRCFGGSRGRELNGFL